LEREQSRLVSRPREEGTAALGPSATFALSPRTRTTGRGGTMAESDADARVWMVRSTDGREAPEPVSLAKIRRGIHLGKLTMDMEVSRIGSHKWEPILALIARYEPVPRADESAPFSALSGDVNPPSAHAPAPVAPVGLHRGNNPAPGSRGPLQREALSNYLAAMQLTRGRRRQCKGCSIRAWCSSDPRRSSPSPPHSSRCRATCLRAPQRRRCPLSRSFRRARICARRAHA
jgi:hypothetical protein